jgi:hypothetical protein
MTLKLFIGMVVIIVYPQCNSNTLNVIATDMLESFKMFIVTVIKYCDSKCFIKSLQLHGVLKF